MNVSNLAAWNEPQLCACSGEQAAARPEVVDDAARGVYLVLAALMDGPARSAAAQSHSTETGLLDAIMRVEADPAGWSHIMDNPNTSLETLELLQTCHLDDRLRGKVNVFLAASPADLSSQSKDMSDLGFYTRRALARDQRTPPELLGWLLTQDHYSHYSDVVMNPSTPNWLLQELANDRDAKYGSPFAARRVLAGREKARSAGHVCPTVLRRISYIAQDLAT